MVPMPRPQGQTSLTAAHFKLLDAVLAKLQTSGDARVTVSGNFSWNEDRRVAADRAVPLLDPRGTAAKPANFF